MNEELKRCPFCGGKVTLDDYTSEKTFMVFCNVCKSRTMRFTSKEIAMAIWNNRVNEPEAV